MDDRFAHDWITPAVANLQLLRPPDKEIQGESHRAKSPHFMDLCQVATLEGHHHKDVGIGIPAGVSTSQGTEQNHLVGGVARHQPLPDRLQRFASHQRGRRGGHGSSSRGFHEECTVPWRSPSLGVAAHPAIAASTRCPASTAKACSGPGPLTSPHSVECWGSRDSHPRSAAGDAAPDPCRPSGSHPAAPHCPAPWRR